MLFKKITGFLLSGIIFVSLLTPAYAAFDIQEVEPYIAGFQDGTVRPNKTISRQEIAVILSRIVNYQTELSIYKIKDVPENNWAYSEIYNMISLGILDMDKIEIKEGVYSLEEILNSIISNSDILKTIDTGNNLETFITAIDYSIQKLSYESKNVSLMDSSWKETLKDTKTLKEKIHNEFAVLTFCEILKLAGFNIDMEKVSQDLNIASSTNFELNKYESEIMGNFRPLDNITRKEMAVALYRILNDGTLSEYLNDYFTDISDLTTEEKQAINFLYEKNVTKGKGENKFDPHTTLTRAEAVVMINRAFESKLLPSTRTDIPEDLMGHWSEKEFVKALI